MPQKATSKTVEKSYFWYCEKNWSKKIIFCACITNASLATDSNEINIHQWRPWFKQWCNQILKMRQSFLETPIAANSSIEDAEKRFVLRFTGKFMSCVLRSYVELCILYGFTNFKTKPPTRTSKRKVNIFIWKPIPQNWKKFELFA